VGVVYEGALPFVIDRTDLSALERPRTKIMLNVANPDDAFRLAMVPNDGVGLARMEFIIANWIRIHPQALVDFATLADAEAKAEIARMTAGYADKPQFFVDQLAQGVAMLAAAFHPHDVILRFSDFKTNEYANLLGGRAYEPVEENPMLGFRGASRYYHPRYRAAFALECRAVKQVREVMGLTNLKVMIPFCRTLEEARLVQTEMATHGLVRGEHGLEMYVMCEIPSNVVLAAEFAMLFDGFSIGSNDLTQLILGVDRDSSIVAPIFDERNPAVKAMIAQVIATCHATGRKIGICGQAPSDYPDFAQFLVAQGIDSMSLNPDAVLSTMAAVLATERALPTSPAAAR
jgi:pyruvate,water dikinase